MAHPVVTQLQWIIVWLVDVLVVANAMKKLSWGVAGTVGMALIIGCGGSGSTFPSNTGTEVTTGTTTTTSTASTTGGTTPVTPLDPGTYSGTYVSSIFAQGGPDTSGPSGDARLVVSDDNSLTLTLGDSKVEGTITSTGTLSAAFTGTFTRSGGTASVRGTITRNATRIVVRFSDYNDTSQSSGTLYSATLS